MGTGFLIGAWSSGRYRFSALLVGVPSPWDTPSSWMPSCGPSFTCPRCSSLSPYRGGRPHPGRRRAPGPSSVLQSHDPVAPPAFLQDASGRAKGWQGAENKGMRGKALRVIRPPEASLGVRWEEWMQTKKNWASVRLRFDGTCSRTLSLAVPSELTEHWAGHCRGMSLEKGLKMTLSSATKGCVLGKSLHSSKPGCLVWKMRQIPWTGILSLFFDRQIPDR